MDCVDPTAMGVVVLPLSPSLPEVSLIFSQAALVCTGAVTMMMTLKGC